MSHIYYSSLSVKVFKNFACIPSFQNSFYHFARNNKKKVEIRGFASFLRVSLIYLRLMIRWS